MAIDVQSGPGGFAGEVRGADLERAGDFSAIHRAFLDHGVIVMRDCSLTPEAQIAFSRRFGPLMGRRPSTPDKVLMPGLPEIVILSNRKVNGETVGITDAGRYWHSDLCFEEKPNMATILHAVEVPPEGGDTLFANQYLAYETLSDGVKATLDGLKAVHDDSRVAGPNANKGRSTQTRDDLDWQPTVNAHPVVRTHPETGRKALYVNIASAHYFEGMTQAESAPLLRYLFDHATRPEFTCRFCWGPGSVAFWDNRCLKHIAVNDYHGHRRDMRRVQLAGDRPV